MKKVIFALFTLSFFPSFSMEKTNQILASIEKDIDSYIYSHESLYEDKNTLYDRGKLVSLIKNFRNHNGKLELLIKKHPEHEKVLIDIWNQTSNKEEESKNAPYLSEPTFKKEENLKSIKVEPEFYTNKIREILGIKKEGTSYWRDIEKNYQKSLDWCKDQKVKYDSFLSEKAVSIQTGIDILLQEPTIRDFIDLGRKNAKRKSWSGQVGSDFVLNELKELAKEETDEELKELKLKYIDLVNQRIRLEMEINGMLWNLRPSMKNIPQEKIGNEILYARSLINNISPCYLAEIGYFCLTPKGLDVFKSLNTGDINSHIYPKVLKLTVFDSLRNLFGDKFEKIGFLEGKIFGKKSYDFLIQVAKNVLDDLTDPELEKIAQFNSVERKLSGYDKQEKKSREIKKVLEFR